jgi:hypothetical protein
VARAKPRGRARRCFFAEIPGAGPCDGKLRKCHLIPAQLLRREGLGQFTWTEAVWVWGCGGIVGIGGHHGQFDHSRSLRVPREMLPAELEAFAAANGLAWYLDREYGPLLAEA